MKKSEINIKLILDENNIPEKIEWMATDKGKEIHQARAMNISFWDGLNRETLKIDLWTKEMTVDEMEMFYIDTIGSMSESLLSATSNTVLSKILKDTGQKMMDLVVKRTEQK